MIPASCGYIKPPTDVASRRQTTQLRAAAGGYHLQEDSHIAIVVVQRTSAVSSAIAEFALVCLNEAANDAREARLASCSRTGVRGCIRVERICVQLAERRSWPGRFRRQPVQRRAISRQATRARSPGSRRRGKRAADQRGSLQSVSHHRRSRQQFPLRRGPNNAIQLLRIQAAVAPVPFELAMNFQDVPRPCGLSASQPPSYLSPLA